MYCCTGKSFRYPYPPCSCSASLQMLKQVSVAKSLAMEHSSTVEGTFSCRALAAFRTISRDATKPVAMSASLNLRCWERELQHEWPYSYKWFLTVTWKLARGWLNACLSLRYCLVCSIDAHAAPRLQEAVVGVSINRQSDCWGCQAWQHTNQCWSFLHWGPSLQSESPTEREGDH